MIRLIQRRLIIPRGDTGSFSIPPLAYAEGGDLAVFSIYDPLTKKTVLEKQFSDIGNPLIISLNHEDTVNLEPKKYLWDIKVYTNPQYDEDNILIYNPKGNGAIVISFFNVPDTEETLDKQISLLAENFSCQNNINLHSPLIHFNKKGKTIIYGTGTTSDDWFVKLWVVAKYPRDNVVTPNPPTSSVSFLSRLSAYYMYLLSEN